MRHIHRLIGCCGASYRGFGQHRRRLVVTCTGMPPLGRFQRWWKPLHLFELFGATKTNAYTTILKQCAAKTNQQSKGSGGGPDSRKFDGGRGIYLLTEVNLVLVGYRWHTFTIPPHNILKSTKYNCLVRGHIGEGNATKLSNFIMCLMCRK